MYVVGEKNREYDVADSVAKLNIVVNIFFSIDRLKLNLQPPALLPFPFRELGMKNMGARII